MSTSHRTESRRAGRRRARVRRTHDRWVQWWTETRMLSGRLIADDSGMSTVEYAIGTVAAAAFGALLYTVVSGDNILSALTGIISRALSTAVS